MKMRKTALLLALVLCLSAILPTTALAAQKDPLVLVSKKDATGEYRYCYDPEGNCLMEEWQHDNICDVTYYSYGINGALADRKVFRDGENIETVYYDDFGNMTERWEYQNGNAEMWKGIPEYDDYGRLTWNTVTGPYDENDKLADDYEVQRTRYEYYDDSVTLFFGRYEQDGNTANGPEPIEWEILDTDGEHILLISKYALDSRAYHSKNANISWKDSDLRKWLNGEFLEKAFSYSEYYQMRPVDLEQNVQDWVFLLSTGETLYCLPNAEDRICQATPYAVRQGAYVNGATKGSWWLLRTPGTASECVASVNSDGTMDYDGGIVTAKKGTVRPAMWVCKTAMTGNYTPTRKHEWREAYEDASTTPTYTLSGLLTYNTEGVLTYEQKEDEYAGEWSTSKRVSYDDFGNITDSMVSIRKFSANNKFMFSEDLQIDTYENTYDKAGRLTKQMRSWDGEPKDLIQYRYDSKGNVISGTKSFYPGHWEVYERNTWTYDRYGNLLSFSVDGQVMEEYTYVPLSQAQWS